MAIDTTFPGLVGFLESHVLEEKVFVVPSYRVGHQIGEALAAQGVSWVNLRFVPLPALANEVAGEALAERGFRQLTGAASLFMGERIFRELKNEGRLDYFDALEVGTGVVRAILRSLRALRMAGVSSDELKPEHFVNDIKGREVALFLKRYEEELERRKAVDLAALYETAVSILEGEQERGEGEEEPIYLCLREEALTRMERVFLEKLAGAALVPVPRGEVCGLERPRAYWDKKGDRPLFQGKNGACPHFSSDLQRMPWLFDPEKAPAPFGDGTVSLFSATGPTNECREVLRRVIQAKHPLDEVEVICPPGSAYPVIFQVIAAKADLNVTFAEGIPLGFTSPGKVFSGLLDWLENDFLTIALCRMIESGALRLSAAKAEEKLSAMKASRHLKNAMIGWGRDRYLTRLKSLRESLGSKAALADEEGEPEQGDRLREGIREVEWLERVIRNLLEYIPARGEDGRVDLGLLCQGMAQVLKKHGRVLGEMDAEALGNLSARLSEAADAARSKLPWEEALEWLRGLGEGLRVGASGPQPAHLHVSSFRTGGFSGRPVTFLLGLDQGAFPGAGLQDPILLDEERGKISAALPTTADALRENLYAMAALLSSLRGRVMLSYSCYDIIDERQSFPSSLLLQVFRLIEGKPDRDYSDLLEWLPESTGMLPGGLDRVFDEIDWWLGKLVPGGRFLEGRAAVRAHFEALDSGILAADIRRSDLLTEFDGLVDASSGEFNPLHNPDIVVSATRLELLAGCPFAYFLNYILGISPPDELEYDQTRWLDPMQRGTLFHEILCDFMRRLRERGEPVDPGRHRSLLDEIAEECIRATREKIPPPSEGIFQRECKEFYESLEVFLSAEKNRTRPVEPVLFEAGFGLKRHDGEGIRDAVEIPVASGARMRAGGKIDRVDRLEENHYRVIDYKSGSFVPYEDIVCFNRGRTLQHALYSRAAETILKRKGMDKNPVVVESGYYFPTRRGEGREILFDRERCAGFEALLQELMSILEFGSFLPHPQARCEYCDYAPLCGAGAAERSKRKSLHNPDAYGVFERLKEFE